LASGSRQRADGSTLFWWFTDPATVAADDIVSFFIDWEDSPILPPRPRPSPCWNPFVQSTLTRLA
jgi:hypothetical protein